MTCFSTQKSKGLPKNQDSLPIILSSFLHKKQTQKMKIELAESAHWTLNSKVTGSMPATKFYL